MAVERWIIFFLFFPPFIYVQIVARILIIIIIITPRLDLYARWNKTRFHSNRLNRDTLYGRRKSSKTIRGWRNNFLNGEVERKYVY